MSNTSLLGSFGGQAGDALFFRNRIVNGCMRIDQRNAGASVTPTTSGTYTLDRWSVGLTQASKFSVQQSAVAPTGFANSLLLTSLSAYSVGAADTFFVQQYIEGFNTADFMFGTASAQTVSLSFWVRSSLTGTFGGSIGNASANYAYPFTYSISAANTWEQKTISIPGAVAGTWVGSTNGRGMRVVFNLGSGANFSGTANTWQVAGASNELYAPTGATSVVGTNGATFYITGVQLESGTATPFERRPIGVELQMCQRYFIKQNVPVFQNCVYFSGAFQNGGSTQTQLPVVMRDIPNVTVSYINNDNAGSVSVSTLNNSRTAQGIRYAFTVANTAFPYAGFTVTSDVSAEL